MSEYSSWDDVNITTSFQDGIPRSYFQENSLVRQSQKSKSPQNKNGDL